MKGETISLSPEALVEALTPDFLDSDLCRRWVLESIYPGAPCCPACGAEIVEPRELSRFWLGSMVRCQACAKRFTAKTNSVLSGIGADFRKLVLFFLLSKLKMPIREISKHVGLDKRTLFLYKHRFNIKK